MLKDWQDHKSYSFLVAYLLGAEETDLESDFYADYKKSDSLTYFNHIPDALLLRSLSRLKQHYLHNIDLYIGMATLGSSEEILEKEMSILLENNIDIKAVIAETGNIADVFNKITTEVNKIVYSVLTYLKIPRPELMSALFYMQPNTTNKDLKKQYKDQIKDYINLYPLGLVIIKGDKIGNYLTWIFRSDRNLLLGCNNILSAGVIPHTLEYPIFSWGKVLNFLEETPSDTGNSKVTWEESFTSSSLSSEAHPSLLGDRISEDLLSKVYQQAFSISTAQKEKSLDENKIKTTHKTMVSDDKYKNEPNSSKNNLNRARPLVHIPTDTRRIESPGKISRKVDFSWSLYVDCNNVDVFMLLGVLQTVGGYSEDNNTPYRIKLFLDGHSNPLWSGLNNLLTDNFTIETYIVDRIDEDQGVTDMLIATHMTRDYLAGSVAMGVLSSSSGFSGVMQSLTDVDFLVAYSSSDVSSEYVEYLKKKDVVRYCVKDSQKMSLAEEHKSDLLTSLCLYYFSQNPPALWVKNKVVAYMYSVFSAIIPSTEMFSSEDIASNVAEVMSDMQFEHVDGRVKITALGAEVGVIV